MSRVLRLFALRRKGSFVHVEGKFFMNQDSALRERLNLEAEYDDHFIVCPGPDHKRYATWLENIEREAARERKEME